MTQGTCELLDCFSERYTPHESHRDVLSLYTLTVWDTPCLTTSIPKYCCQPSLLNIFQPLLLSMNALSAISCPHLHSHFQVIHSDSIIQHDVVMLQLLHTEYLIYRSNSLSYKVDFPKKKKKSAWKSLGTISKNHNAITANRENRSLLANLKARMLKTGG